MNSLDEIREIVSHCVFENFEFAIIASRGSIQLQATWVEPCISTGKPERQYSRRWLISPEMARSEIVQTCFKLAITAVEHRAREAFKYKGRRIFGPHFDVDRLHQLCTHQGFDVRDAESQA